MNTVIVDFNNLAFSKLFSKYVMEKTKYEVHDINYDVWRYSVFSSIYSYIKKFNDIYEVILAIDSNISWRKIYFPRYKAHRKDFKEKYNIDWDEYNKVVSDFLDDIKSHIPFKIIWRKYAEGDDIIGTIILNNKDKNFIIISSDQDYLQLCRSGVQLYSINKQDFIKHPNPEMFIKESSLMGQPKDNIFSVITPLDYPNELRKPPFGKKKAEKFLIEGLDTALDKDIEYNRKYVDNNNETVYYKTKINLRERYEFNRNLIDLSKTPKTIKNKILRDYNNYKYPHPQEIYEFFQKYGWPYFLDNITNIENTLHQLYFSENS
ncbi:MAG: hypothetical protein ACOCRK_01025 [bacterium]